MSCVALSPMDPDPARSFSSAPLSGKAWSGKASSGKPRLALCGLALIDNRSGNSCGLLFLSRNGCAREIRPSNQDLRIHRSSTTIGGIAELAAFKLQWICSDRNIDGARKVWAAGYGLGAVSASCPDCRLLHSALI